MLCCQQSYKTQSIVFFTLFLDAARDQEAHILDVNSLKENGICIMSLKRCKSHDICAIVHEQCS